MSEIQAEQFLPLAFKLSKPFVLRYDGIDYPVKDSEFYGEACVALMIAVKNFEEERGVPFLLYAWHSIFQRLRLTARRRCKYLSRRRDLPDYEMHDKTHSQGFQTVEAIEAAKFLLSRLCLDDRDIAKMRMEGKTFRAIAEELGVSSNLVHRQWKTIIVPFMQDLMKVEQHERDRVRNESVYQR